MTKSEILAEIARGNFDDCVEARLNKATVRLIFVDGSEFMVTVTQMKLRKT